MADSLDWGPPFGFAVRRNGSCLEAQGECRTDAGVDPITKQIMYRCCPSGSRCSNGNIGMCCRDQNCKQQISNPAHCANQTWDLYRNFDGGYFCCDQEQWGYNRTGGGVGCAALGERPVDSITRLNPTSFGKIQVLLTRHEPSSDITRRDPNID